VKTIAESARRAGRGARIEVDAGVYTADTAVWTRDDVSISAVGGRVRLVAAGAAAEEKGIWVVRARHMTVEGFDFEGARVAARNGAGIRLESGSLRVRDCSFVHNEMGLLTGNDPETELDVEDSEFAYNQRPDGHNHNLYVGAIKRFSIRGSYLHHGHIGHLLKSRAALSDVRYNRLTDEADGSASYELEFPDGGIAYVIGNIIEQSAATENPHLVSFGAESYRWPANEIYLVHNTLVDDRPVPGTFLRVQPGAGSVRVIDNLLVGRGDWNVPAGADMHNNVTLERRALVEGGADAYHPGRAAMLAAAVNDAGSAHGISLTPDREYRHPRHSAALVRTASWPGALSPVVPPTTPSHPDSAR
jgi:hypothetical protein